MNQTTDELELAVAAARRGDTSAANRVLELIKPQVARYCRARVGIHERGHLSADDVTQEVLIAVLTALPNYRDQGKPFMAFVYGIASHKVADAHRSAGRNKSDPVEHLPETLAAGDGPEDTALASDANAQMAALLNELPEKAREIIRLRVIVGLSAEETAEVVGSTPGAVRVAQHRAIKQLRDKLEKEGDGRWR